jgi:predicted TIM-barrel fold metal-dependent hydrolase
VRALAYEPLARRNPKATIILAHAGGYQVLETFLLMKALDNVYFDVSFSFSYFAGSSVIQDLEFALRRAPAGRVLYGSDFPEVDSGEYLQLVRNHGRSLSEEQTQQLFSGAAATIFGIG